MAVYSDFERKYQLSPDPWGIGDATGEYYDVLFEFIQQTKSNGAVALDVGCGEGAFTARLSALAHTTWGIDISRTAIKRARKQFPDISFVECDVRQLGTLSLKEGSVDLILVSQVLYYLAWAEASDALDRLNTFMGPGANIVGAANCSGGDYFRPEEFRALFEDHFDVTAEKIFQHHMFLVGKRCTEEVVITVDYEVAEHGDRELISRPEVWEAQVIGPCDELMAVCEDFSAKLTVLLEICQLWFLDQYLTETAERVRAQLVEVIQRGHDVQVHMHVRWLPEKGASRDETTGAVCLNMSEPRLQDLSQKELESIFGRAKQELEELLQPVRDDYEAIVFRAGKYQVQPHRKVFEALAATGYRADTSVWHGGFLSIYDRHPGYDFRSLWTQFKPYWPDLDNINMPAVDGSKIPKIVEVPILAESGTQWSFDYQTAGQLTKHFASSQGKGPRVMIGHTKSVTSTSLQELRGVFEWLESKPFVVFKRMQDVADRWWNYSMSCESTLAAREYIKRSTASPQELWKKLSPYHKLKVEICEEYVRDLVARKGGGRILDIGCGTGELFLLPLWFRLRDLGDVEILGTDVDKASIARATNTVVAHDLNRISFKAQPAEALTDTYDLVISTEVIEHMEGPSTFVEGLRRVTANDGSLILSTPNGFGYGELERRLLYVVFAIVKRSPIVVRRVLQSIYRKLRLWRRRTEKQDRIQLGENTRKAFGTLNFANDVHVQFFTLKRLTRILLCSGFTPRVVHNVKLLGGLAGGLIEKRFGFRKVLAILPPQLASGWLIICDSAANTGQKVSRVRQR